MRTASTEPRLKLFDSESQAVAAPKMKRIRLKQILGALADAARSERSWLNDFADDEVKISADLYEILTLSRRLRPTA